jgi:tellurite methyltransferase
VTPDLAERERAGEAAPVSPASLTSVLRAGVYRPNDSFRPPPGAARLAARPVIVDLRSRDAYRRAHLHGAISVPGERLARSLFLLPPRERPLVLIAHRPKTAVEAARFLAARGWSSVAWLDGSMRAIASGLCRSGWEPNRAWEAAPLLREFHRRLPRDGDALDLACGSGREAAFLALHRPQVLGVDILPDALRQARTLAREAGVAAGRLRLRRIDLTETAAVRTLLRPWRFRLVTCFRYLDRSLLPVIAETLAPGGWLVYQTFLEAQARAGRRPLRPEYLLKPGELHDVFAAAGGIEIIHYAEGPDARGDHLAALVARAKGRASRGFSAPARRRRESNPDSGRDCVAPRVRPAGPDRRGPAGSAPAAR